MPDNKPLVTALATAAAPSLRAWVRSNTDEVEGVVDAALAIPANVVLADLSEEEEEGEVFTPLAFGDADDLADDGLTDEQRKRALSWLKKRAGRTEGEFDAEAAHDAISLLPGWSSEILETRRAVPMNGTTAGTAFPVALVEAGFTQTPAPSGRVQSPTVGDGYTSGRKSNIEGVSRVSFDDVEAIRVTPEIAATFLPFDAKKTKVKDLPAGRWVAGRVRYEDGGTVLLFKPVLVFAERGGLRVTNAKGETATVAGGKSAWKALYGESKWELGEGSWTEGGLGLAAAAKALVAPLERRVKAREGAQATWGKHLCPVCFGHAAVTPTSHHMVDHRHERPGVGYNVAPCAGNRYRPYKESPEGTRWALQNYRSELPNKVEKLQFTLEHPERQAYKRKVVVLDERGLPIRDLVPPHEASYRGEKRNRVQHIVVQDGHPLFPQEYERDLRIQQRELKALRDSIKFYAAAVRLWEPGLDDILAISKGMRDEDTPSIPEDLL